MPRQFLGFASLAALAILFSGNPLYAQFFPLDSKLGPYVHNATLRLPDGTRDEAFGFRTAISGDLALVAGTGGVIYTFERDPQTESWRETDPIRPTGEAEGFGRAFAFDRNTAIVGSEGAAYLFRRNASGRWREIATLTPSEGHENFGISVGIAGNQAIVGSAGAAYIFRRHQETSAAWKEMAVLVNPEPGGFGFGGRVGITHDAAIVTSDDVAGPFGFFVNIFVRNEGPTEIWSLARRSLTAGLVLSGGVAIHGDTAVSGGSDVFNLAFIYGRDKGGPNAWGTESVYGGRGEACCTGFQSLMVNEDKVIFGVAGARRIQVLARNQGGDRAWQPIAVLDDEVLSIEADARTGLGASISGDTALLGVVRALGNPDASPNEVFVVVSDLDRDGLRDGIDPCPRDSLNNVADDCQRTSAAHSVLNELITQGDLTTETEGNREFITATFTNASTTAVKNPFFEVTELTGRNALLNADEGRGRVGATLSPDVGDGVLSPGESMTVTFRIRLRTQNPFQFFVAFHGDPLP